MVNVVAADTVYVFELCVKVVGLGQYVVKLVFSSVTVFPAVPDDAAWDGGCELKTTGDDLAAARGLE